MSRRDLMWLINMLSFALLVILVLTGLIHWLVLPHGGGPPTGFGASARRLIRDIHGWGAVFFCVTIAVHIGLHWGTVRANLKKTF